ncbi:histidine phosphatase superfamily [Jimgerdemannia flammicorona]|uniref:Histidine phosphatase superfamily n=1 Tax=Jimgerdemannia flammicorona TaxID=994334 RepID=A0A433CYH5_9FUNG|nr:histidine phosphatase superfamily [Jimgerdemannia flammicorona]
MPRPTHIILVRHGESEGNLDHSLFQRKPDHRHKLTERGHEQAFTAGRRLRELLEGGNKVQFYVSPYQRTRETFRGLMRGLTGLGEEKADVGEGERWKGKVTYFEEPRLREQDWGNYQPDEQRMREIRSERQQYGHLFCLPASFSITISSSIFPTVSIVYLAASRHHDRFLTRLPLTPHLFPRFRRLRPSLHLHRHPASRIRAYRLPRQVRNSDSRIVDPALLDEVVSLSIRRI